MKIALVLTGHMRCWQQVFINTYQYILEPFQPSVYITTWDDEGYWISPEADTTKKGINPESPKINWHAVKNTYGAEHIDVQSFKLYEPSFIAEAKIFEPYCQEIRPVNTLSQFWLMNEGMNNFYRNGGISRDYDLVIRMRPDLVVGPEIVDVIANADPTKFYTLFHRNHTGQGTGDMFFMSTRRKIEDLTWSMSNIKELTRLTLKYNRFCPHIFVKDLIESRSEHVEVNIPKQLQHTPNGQYKDWKSE